MTSSEVRRPYDHLERLAGRAENQGGFIREARDGHELARIDDEEIEGRDLVELLVILYRRACDRAQGTLNVQSYRQGYQDAVRDVREKLGELR